MARTRVCHVVVRPELYGAQRSMLDLVRGLDRERFECSVICAGEGPLTRVLSAEGIGYILAPALTSPVRPHRDLRALFQLLGIMRSRRFDLVHTHTSKGGLLGRLAARMAGVPRVIHHVHGYAFHDESSRLEWVLYKTLETWAGRLADRVIFVNHEEREFSNRHGLARSEQSLTLFNAVDMERFDPARHGPTRAEFRRDQGLVDDTLAILVAGRIEAQKQPLILPEIARELERLAPKRPWRILVMGSGSYQTELERAIDAAGMGSRIQLLGWRPDPAQVMVGCDIALLPSLWEGLPRVLVEAHAAGLPCVASDIKGNREVVVPETGFLCAPKAPGDYARVLAQLLGDAELREGMGAAALARACEHFSLAGLLLAVTGVYDRLLDSTRD